VLTDASSISQLTSALLPDSAARILESITDAFFALDADWRFTYVNAQAERLLARPRTELVGRVVWDEFPDAVGSVFEREYKRAAAARSTASFEAFFPPLGSWFEVRAFPADSGLSVFFHDITEAVERRRREQFLAGLAERARRLPNPDAVIADALQSVGEFLGVSRCVFVDIDVEADTCTTQPDYRADESVVSMAGVFPISSFGDLVGAAYVAGRAVVVADVHNDPVQVPPDSIPAYDAVGIRAHVGVPVVHSDRLVSCIGVHSKVPRLWNPEEVALLQTVVDRTWLTVEVARQSDTLVREAEATRRLLESITDAFMAFDRLWKFTYINDQSEKIMGRARETLLGQFFWEAFPAIVGTRFEQEYRRAVQEQAPATFEEYYPPLGIWIEVRAYPSADGGLSVFYRDVSERKAMEEERERLAARERNIAAQLQDALQPPLPEWVPGLEIASFTRPALSEAEIGGDFFDIFPLDKGLYAVIIGDVSGKGLAAAAQLALIRNSLRTTLYLSQRPAPAAANLNAIVTAHELLVGFVTAFVGVYDAGTGEITYASCGHEPGLVRRLDGRIEELETTGPPLGVDQAAVYSENTLMLGSGDLLLLYTDGLSEAGPDRLHLLGTSGLSRLLAALPQTAAVQAQAEALVQSVSDYAGGLFRDDVAVLTLRRS